VHPRAEKNIGGKFARKSYKCTPRQSVKKLGGIWTVGVVNLLVLACVLRATTKKVATVNFLGRECTPRENPGYAYVSVGNCG